MISKLICFMLLTLTCCSPPKLTGKRLSFAKGKMSLVLPDSNLIATKPYLWGPDCNSCNYSRIYFFHNDDSTVRVGVTIKVYPDTLGRRWPWKWLFNEQRTRDEFVARNRDFTAIEKLSVDSISRSTVIDAHFIEKGRQSFMKEISVRQGQHSIQLNFFVPDNPQMREAVANSQASIFIDPHYLASSAESYQDFKSNP